MDNPFWMMIAYTAGTGGSLLSIGSAAGVALMGIEKVDFISYYEESQYTSSYWLFTWCLLFYLYNLKSFF